MAHITVQSNVNPLYDIIEKKIISLDGLEPKPPAEGDPDVSRARSLDMSTLRYGTAFRLLKVRQAFLEGQSVEDIFNVTKIDPWFLDQIKQIIVLNGNSPM